MSSDHPSNQPIPTIRDIAERVGVHKATVAAVLNGGRSTARVSEATRQRIVAAAKELRYSPNALARGLKMVRFKSLGLAFNYADPSWITSDQYGTALLTGIIETAHTADYNVTHFHKPWKDAEHSAAGFRGQGIDGFLVIAPFLVSDIVVGLSSLGIPLVVISRKPGDPAVPSVLLDNAAGMRLAMEHLLTLGHTKIAHLVGSRNTFDSTVREDSFLQIMAEARLTVLSGYLSGPEDVYPESASDATPTNDLFRSRDCYHRTRTLLKLPDPPTAIVAGGGGMGEPALYAARDLGLRIPEDLSIVGFDDTREASLVTPPMTTIRQPLIEMGQCAARLLIARLERENVSPGPHVFQPELVLRSSTGPAPDQSA